MGTLMSSSTLLLLSLLLVGAAVIEESILEEEEGDCKDGDEDCSACVTACQFPFTLTPSGSVPGSTHHGCTRRLNAPGETRAWCSTLVDHRGRHVGARWGYCPDTGCPEEPEEEVENGPEAVIVTGDDEGDNDGSSHHQMRPVHTDNEDEEKGSSSFSSLSSVPSAGDFLPGLDRCAARGHPDDSGGGRIEGGRAARLFDYPFAGLIGFETRRGIRYSCGATLINRRYALTAAHCFGGSHRRPLHLLLGDLDLRRRIDCQRVPGRTRRRQCAPRPQKISISAVTTHPSFASDPVVFPFLHDIALVRLARPATLNENVQLVCLPVDKRATAAELNLPDLSDSSLKDSVARVIGWGRLRADDTVGAKKLTGASSSVLMEVKVPFVPHGACAEAYSRIDVDGSLIDMDRQLCAGLTKGKGTCSGDSGGPILLRKSIQLGVTSFSSQSCADGTPAGFTRVSAYMDWIRRQLRP